MPRMIRDTMLHSDRINNLTAEGERFFVRLMLVADDYGRFGARPELLKSSMFPIKDEITIEHIEKMTVMCQSCGLVVLYEVEGDMYLLIPRFNQRLRAKKSKCPDPIDGHVTVIRQPKIKEDKIREDKRRKEKRREEKRREEKKGGDKPRDTTNMKIPPELEEVREYIESKKYPIDPVKWWNHYDSKGWMIGKNRMKNWHSAVATWLPDGWKGGSGHQPPTRPEHRVYDLQADIDREARG